MGLIQKTMPTVVHGFGPSHTFILPAAVPASFSGWRTTVRAPWSHLLPEPASRFTRYGVMKPHLAARKDDDITRRWREGQPHDQYDPQTSGRRGQ
jgi:hypothetical protein